MCLCLCEMSNVAEYFVTWTTCVIWIGCETAIWAVTSHAWLGTMGSVVDTHVLAAGSTNGTLSDRSMNANLRMLHCGALSAWLKFRPETVPNAVRSRPTSSCFSWSDPSRLFYVFFCFIFRFSDFSVASVFRRGGSLRRISKISNQLIYSEGYIRWRQQMHSRLIVLLLFREVCTPIL